jgi:hypothetical protein
MSRLYWWKDEAVWPMYDIVRNAVQLWRHAPAVRWTEVSAYPLTRSCINCGVFSIGQDFVVTVPNNRRWLVLLSAVAWWSQQFLSSRPTAKNSKIKLFKREAVRTQSVKQNLCKFVWKKTVVGSIYRGLNGLNTARLSQITMETSGSKLCPDTNRDCNSATPWRCRLLARDTALSGGKAPTFRKSCCNVR